MQCELPPTCSLCLRCHELGGLMKSALNTQIAKYQYWVTYIASINPNSNHTGGIKTRKWLSNLSKGHI